MKLVTWNCCRGPYEKKLQLLDSLSPDIAVLQECARPSSTTDNVLWFGENPRQGIAVKATDQYTLRPLPELSSVPKFVYPIEVIGPESFMLLAVWSKGRQKYRYVMGVVKAVQLYRTLFEKGPTVLMGDLNSNLIWDSDSAHPKDLNHSALLRSLEGFGLVSAYHIFHGEQQGSETRPTCYLLWNEKRPYHIDYCFVPQSWVSRLEDVEVGSYQEWKRHSDHRPLIVSLSASGSSANAAAGQRTKKY